MSIFLYYQKAVGNRIYCPIETCVVLTLIKYTGTSDMFKVVLIKDEDYYTSIPVILEDISLKQEDPSVLTIPVKCCRLPVYYDGEFYCIAGLCSVLRQIIVLGEKFTHLLGFRNNCLSACAEQSTWTKFCEIDSMKSVADFVSGSDKWMSHLQELDRKLQEPLKVHNKGKTKESQTEETTQRYVESHHFLLSDFILVVCAHVIVINFNPIIFESIPHMKIWYDLILSDSLLSNLLSTTVTADWHESFNWNGEVSNLVNSVNKDSSHSMSKSQKSRKFIARSKDALNFLNNITLQIKQRGIGYGNEINLDTSDVPYHALPESGDLPADRVERKCHQLVCMTKAVMKICSPGDIIVDFCSGGGHLGLLIAYSIPRCTMILLDNKPQSLSRAERRARELGLTNLYIVQSNVDYFVGHFDVGICLHACGVASDLVMQKCALMNASMVVSPCCYGKIQTCHTVSYPRSFWLKQHGISSSDHHLMSHCADRQAPEWMDWIDADRLEWARELGYTVHLGKMTPLDCSPKNNMLVASKRTLEGS